MTWSPEYQVARTSGVCDVNTQGLIPGLAPRIRETLLVAPPKPTLMSTMRTRRFVDSVAGLELPGLAGRFMRSRLRCQRRLNWHTCGDRNWKRCRMRV